MIFVIGKTISEHFARKSTRCESKKLILAISIFRDFNPEENVSEKLRKVNEIKDSRGLRKFIKETLNASTGKISHDLLGSVEIPLKVSLVLSIVYLQNLFKCQRYVLGYLQDTLIYFHRMFLHLESNNGIPYKNPMGNLKDLEVRSRQA